MKKNIIIIVILAIISLSYICISIDRKENDALKFKYEYEILNNKTDVETGKKYLKINISEDNPIIYKNVDEIIDTLKNGTGVIYFGFPECPWCRNAIPALLEAAKQMGINEIYYYNALDIRDIRKLNSDGEIVVEKEGTKEYNELLKIMNDKLPSYDGLNNDSIKRLYFPTVVFVKDGSIIDINVSTVSSQKDPYKKLDDEQFEELVSIYSKNINKVYNIICDDAC